MGNSVSSGSVFGFGQGPAGDFLDDPSCLYVCLSGTFSEASQEVIVGVIYDGLSYAGCLLAVVSVVMEDGL